jgi:DNA polymerase III subunit delta'
MPKEFVPIQWRVMWDIIGQDRAVDLLAQDLAGGKLPHAILLIGPRGAGKTHLAFELAKALTCTGSDPPCQNCVHCHQVSTRSHPDVLLIEPADDKETISAIQARGVRSSASLRPFQARCQVYIISGAERLTPQAADALLKTLEEPQPQVFIILTAPDGDALPATVVSRCRIYGLQSVDRAELIQALMQRGIEIDEAEQLARLAQGSVGWALRAAKDPGLVKSREELVTSICSMLDLDLRARLQVVEAMTTGKRSRDDIRGLVELNLSVARDLLLLSQELSPQLVDQKEGETLRLQASRYGLARIHGYVRALRLATERIDQNVDPRLALEAVFTGL